MGGGACIRESSNKHPPELPQPQLDVGLANKPESKCSWEGDLVSVGSKL